MNAARFRRWYSNWSRAHAVFVVAAHPKERLMSEQQNLEIARRGDEAFGLVTALHGAQARS
jgi:hypothetical protein